MLMMTVPLSKALTSTVKHPKVRHRFIRGMWFVRREIQVAIGYYAGLVRNGRSALLLGPYESRETAAENVKRAHDAACRSAGSTLRA
jgi:hypothetical protein